jgi:hypothetical protein
MPLSCRRSSHPMPPEKVQRYLQNPFSIALSEIQAFAQSKPRKH